MLRTARYYIGSYVHSYIDFLVNDCCRFTLSSPVVSWTNLTCPVVILVGSLVCGIAESRVSDVRTSHKNSSENAKRTIRQDPPTDTYLPTLLKLHGTKSMQGRMRQYKVEGRLD